MLNLLRLERRNSNFKWANIYSLLLCIFRILLVNMSESTEHNYINEIYIIALVLYFMYFGYVEIDKTDLIMNFLPISKRDIVKTNYTVIFITFANSLIYALIYLGALKVMGLTNNNPITIRHIIISLSIFIIHISILLPVYHISPRLYYPCIALSIFASISIVNTNSVAIEGLLVGVKSIIFFLISMIIMIISLLISINLYNKREFVRG